MSLGKTDLEGGLQYTPEGDPKMDLKRNVASINRIRGAFSELSDVLRREVARWCVSVEGKCADGVPWDELYEMVKDNDKDKDALTRACSSFAEYAHKADKNRVEDVSPDSLPEGVLQRVEGLTSMTSKNVVAAQQRAPLASVFPRRRSASSAALSVKAAGGSEK